MSKASPEQQQTLNINIHTPHFGHMTNIQTLLQKHEKMVMTTKTNWFKQTKNPQKQQSLKTTNQPENININNDYFQKAKMVREIQLQISILESKSRQPGIKNHDIQPIGTEIYNKLDQYFILFYQQKFKSKGSFLNSKLHENGNNKINKLSRKKHSVISTASVTKPAFSAQQLRQESEKEFDFNKKQYNLDGNLSVTSLEDKEIENQERPFIENRMSESELQDLDKQWNDEKSLIGQEIFDQNYIQLKESIRVMEERIAFLIYRLEQNKKEIVGLKESNKILEDSVEEDKKLRKQLRISLEQKNVDYSLLCQDFQKLQIKFKMLESQNKKIVTNNDELEKQLINLRQIIECAKRKNKQYEKKINSLQAHQKIKHQEYIELSHAYHSLEKDFQERRDKLRGQLKQSQQEKTELKDMLRAYRARMQAEGFDFSFDEASQLKQLFQQKDFRNQIQVQRKMDNLNKKVTELLKQKEQMKKQRQILEKALIKWIDPQQISKLDNKNGSGINIFMKINQYYHKIVEQSKQKSQKILQSQDRIQILKEQCQQKYIELQNIKTQLKDLQKILQKVTSQKQQLLKYLNTHTFESNQRKNKQQEKSSKIRLSKIDSCILDINLAQKIVEDKTQMTLQYFIKKKLVTSIPSILKFGLKMIQYSMQLQITHKKKLPSLAPHVILLKFKNLSQIDVCFSLIAKKQEEQGLMYQAPEIVLGFSESSASHCWTIGLILDQMLHGKRFFKSFNEILSHKDNYNISSQTFKSMTFLLQMIRKNHKNRIGLDHVKQKIQEAIHKQKK